MKKLLLPAIALGVSILSVIGIILFSGLEDGIPSWVKILVGLIVLGVVVYVIARQFNTTKLKLPVTWTKSWWFIGGLILVILVFRPWNWFGNGLSDDYFTTVEKYFEAKKKNEKLKIGKNTLVRGERKYMLLYPNKNYDFKPINLKIGEKITARYIRISTDQLQNEILWEKDKPININGYPYGMKDPPPDHRAPDVIPLVAYGLFEVSYDGNQKDVGFEILKF